MLCGLSLVFVLSDVLSVPMTRNLLYFYAQIGCYNEDCTLPDFDWVLVQAEQLQRDGSFVGCTEPLVIGEMLIFSLGYRF